MFIGHFAIGFASKRLAPRTSLATLTAAALFPDILFPIFLLVGLEHARIAPGITEVMPVDLVDYPWSHSLLMTIIWSILFAALYVTMRKDMTAGLVLGLAALSHFVLDWVTHRPDMQLSPGCSVRVGLGLWYSLRGTLLVEGAMFVAAVALYATFTRARDRQGTFGFWSYVALLVLAFAGSVFGPPAPSITALGVTGVLSNLLFFWIAWFDRHREPVLT